MNGNNQYLGKVEAGRFRLLWPIALAGTSRRLTLMAMQVSQPPEVQELHLNEYDDQIILVRGNADTQWIWSAEVVEVAGPILTLLSEVVLGKAVDVPKPVA